MDKKIAVSTCKSGLGFEEQEGLDLQCGPGRHLLEEPGLVQEGDRRGHQEGQEVEAGHQRDHEEGELGRHHTYLGRRPQKVL